MILGRVSEASGWMAVLWPTLRISWAGAESRLQDTTQPEANYAYVKVGAAHNLP